MSSINSLTSRLGPRPADTQASSDVSEFRPLVGQRAIIIHYHLFKNAGTSVDRTLRENFGERWVETEGKNRKGMPSSDVKEFLTSNPSVLALSSHTALLPPPAVPGTRIIPVVFVRHPLDRIRSVYDFERLQIAETAGAQKAKETDLAGYIEWRLGRALMERDRSATNFQTHRLAKGSPGGSPIERALRTVDELPFVGVVERYEASIARLQNIVAVHFPHVRLRAYQDNRTAAGVCGLEDRLAGLQERIGPELFARLHAANLDDLEIWDRVRGQYAQ